MKKLLALSSLLFISSIVSCNKPIENTKDEIKLTELPETDLKRPKQILENTEDLIYAIDYLSFYKIDEPVTLKISDSYASTVGNIKFEFSKALEKSYIGDVFLTELDQSKFKSDKIITLKTNPKDFATEATIGNGEVTLLKSTNYNQYTQDLDATYKLEKDNKGKVKVEDSEQLYYTISNGYLPEVVKGSKAELVYEEMLNVLSKTYKEDNSNYQNLKNIYDYLTHDVKYDKLISKSDAFDLEKNQAYFLEGALLNKLAVCDGKAKAYSILCNYIGIENVRIRATNDELAKHAYNYVKLDDTWYLSCSTWGANIINIDEKSYQVPSYEMFLTTIDTAYGESWTYSSLMHDDIEKLVSNTPYDYFKKEGLEFHSYEEVLSYIKDYLETNDSNEEFSFEFKSNENDPQNIIDICTKLGNELPNHKFEALKNKPDSENIYSILVLNV